MEIIDDPFVNPYALEWLEAFEEAIREYELSGYDQLRNNDVKF